MAPRSVTQKEVAQAPKASKTPNIRTEEKSQKEARLVLEQAQEKEFPLRQIAANFISEDEDDGLKRLDAFTGRIYNQYSNKYSLLMARAAWLCGLFVVLIIFAIIIDRLSAKYGDPLYVVAVLSFFGVLFSFWSWQAFQYGSLSAKKSQEAFYGESDKDVALKLDGLFKHLQSGKTPKAYFKKNGSDRYLDQKHFYGGLRFLLLSPERTYRELVFQPVRPWPFSHETFMRVNIKALIQRTNASPDKRQKSDQHDYKRLLLLIIEHPALKQIIRGEPRDAGRLKKLITSLSDADADEQDMDFDDLTPEKSQMYKFVGEILTAIEKNKSLPG
ncbi:hypothetical protein [Acidocella sp.]|uniref:hypothetical protein n=1 Tax=Acidocella sp. TaxID=50710 RepID=UPI00262D9008|nr:hypothetical protein [Acidocella sp.]